MQEKNAFPACHFHKDFLLLQSEFVKANKNKGDSFGTLGV